MSPSIIPDNSFVDKVEIAGQAFGTLKNIDSQLVALRLEQDGQEKKDSDVHSVDGDNNQVTYADRRAALEKQKANVIKSAAPVKEELQAVREANMRNLQATSEGAPAS